MITIKDEAAFRLMREAGKRLAEIFEQLKERVVPGVSTLELDAYIEEALKRADLVTQMKGYSGTYWHVSCISVNAEVVHGVPRSGAIVAEGDLVKVDVCAAWQGYCADMARPFLVGASSEVASRLVTVARESLDAGISKVLPGNKLSDVSAAIQQVVEKAGFGVVRDFAGHGIGRRMHEAPEILNYGRPGRGPTIREGMAFALEPMITAGRYEVCVGKDGWTARTVDGKLAAHIEDTVLVTAHGPEVITQIL